MERDANREIIYNEWKYIYQRIDEMETDDSDDAVYLFYYEEKMSILSAIRDIIEKIEIGESK